MTVVGTEVLGEVLEHCFPSSRASELARLEQMMKTTTPTFTRRGIASDNMTAKLIDFLSSLLPPPLLLCEFVEILSGSRDLTKGETQIPI